MKQRILSFGVAALLGLCAASALAQNKIGFVNSDRVMREAAPAVKAQQRLEREFETRDQELQRLADQMQKMQEEMERNQVTMSESDRRDKERIFNDLNRDFQRKQREFREDLNQRRNEELALMLDRANLVINRIAEAEQYDLIVQDAVFHSPKIDITDKVIKALESN